MKNSEDAQIKYLNILRCQIWKNSDKYIHFKNTSKLNFIQSFADTTIFNEFNIHGCLLTIQNLSKTQKEVKQDSEALFLLKGSGTPL